MGACGLVLCGPGLMLNDGFFAFALRGVFRLAIDQATPDLALLTIVHPVFFFNKMLSGPLEATLRTFSSVTSHQKLPPTIYRVSHPFYDSCTATSLHIGVARATSAN